LINITVSDEPGNKKRPGIVADGVSLTGGNLPAGVMTLPAAGKLASASGNISNGGNISTGIVRLPGTISPKQQKEVDRRTWQDLDEDFPLQKKTTTNENVAAGSSLQKKKTTTAATSEHAEKDLDDSSSDFESPLLLKRARNFGLPPPKTRSSENVPGKSTDPNGVETEIEDFGSPPLYPGKGGTIMASAAVNLPTSSVAEVGEKSKSLKASSSGVLLKKKAENRWGLQIDEITASQRKKLQRQKQSRIDGFFKNPPAAKGAANNNGGGIFFTEKLFSKVSHCQNIVKKSRFFEMQPVLETEFLFLDCVRTAMRISGYSRAVKPHGT
jgi:hypothetical protein